MVTKFCELHDGGGQKSLAYSIFMMPSNRWKEERYESGLEVWRRAMSNVAPFRRGEEPQGRGATFQVPRSATRAQNQPYHQVADRLCPCPWRKTMTDKLAAEILAASKGEGLLLRKR